VSGFSPFRSTVPVDQRCSTSPSSTARSSAPGTTNLTFDFCAQSATSSIGVSSCPERRVRNYLSWLWLRCQAAGISPKVLQIVIDAFAARHCTIRNLPSSPSISASPSTTTISTSTSPMNTGAQCGSPSPWSKSCRRKNVRSCSAGPRGCSRFLSPSARTVEDVEPFILRLTNDEKILFLAFLAYVAGPSNCTGFSCSKARRAAQDHPSRS